MDVLTLFLEKAANFKQPLWEAEEVVLKRNEILHDAGVVHTNIYLVADGALRIVYTTDKGAETIRFGYEGSLFATLDSFLTGQPTAYSVEALRKTTLKVMRRENFTKFIDHNSENLVLWNTILSHTVASLLQRERDLLAPSPQERYETVLKQSPQLFREVPHKYIASYLRMAPETLSRLQKS